MTDPQPVEPLSDETPIEKATREYLAGCQLCAGAWRVHYSRRGEYLGCRGE